MDQIIKEQWVAALRSGDYTQGQNRLTIFDPKGNRFDCCLGVLCDLAVQAGATKVVSERAWLVLDDDGEAGRQVFYGEGDDSADSFNPDTQAYKNDSAFLPASVVAWAGLPSRSPEVESEARTLSSYNDGGEVETETRTLSSYNDSGFNYLQIAALIEDNL